LVHLLVQQLPPLPPRTSVVFARVVVNFSPPQPHVAARNKRSTRQLSTRRVSSGRNRHRKGQKHQPIASARITS
jgi:hypothetical protein